MQKHFFWGELSLNGHIKPIKGALPISFDAHALKKKRLIVPAINAEEAALIEENEVIGVQTLTELISFLGGETTISPTSSPRLKTTTHMNGDIADVKGQKQAKRALQIAAAGHHNILFIGSPGAGKTMLAQRLPTIMPALRRAELLETSKIYSISGKMGRNALITQRPFRTPHHTISEAGLIGGGSIPQPGEISLAHNGILFLDELVEFKRSTLEILRQPLESGDVHIARAQQTTSYPASFILIAALNPCPCGYFGDPNRNCSCSPIQIKKYLTKLSGPLLDRIDLQIYLPPVSYDETQEETATSSAELSQTVTHAIDFQHKRSQTEWNAKLTATDIEKKCHLTPAAQACIEQLFKTCNLSMRGYHKIIKVASTIADLAQSELIEEQHIQEASMYRSLDQTLERMQQ